MHHFLPALKRPLTARHWLWLALLGGWLVAAPAVGAKAPLASARTQSLPPDRATPLPSRHLQPARLRELAAQREFRYVEAAESTAFWDALWDRIWRWLDQLRGTRTGRLSWKYGVYAVLVATLVFAVLKLLQVDLTGVFGRAPRRPKLAYVVADENIHEVDFHARLAEAEEAGNYRLATRLGYLEILKSLTDQGLIHWQPDKTNHAYLHELPAGPLRESFREATRQFEYVWYGELRLSAGLYQQVRAGQRAVAGSTALRPLRGSPAVSTATSTSA